MRYAKSYHGGVTTHLGPTWALLRLHLSSTWALLAHCLCITVLGILGNTWGLLSDDSATTWGLFGDRGHLMTTLGKQLGALIDYWQSILPSLCLCLCLSLSLCSGRRNSAAAVQHHPHPKVPFLRSRLAASQLFQQGLYFLHIHDVVHFKIFD